MDSSTLKFHRQLLRFVLGAAKSYQEWVDEQAAVLAVESLKQQKTELATNGSKKKDVATTHGQR